MASEEVYDVIVIGAGVMGSSAALDLVTRGKRVVLLEQFTVPHDQGSSCGRSRIIRRAYNQHCYAQMMPEAYDRWRHLEKDLGQELLVQTGMLITGPKSSADMRATQKTMDTGGVPYINLTHSEMTEKYPQLTLPQDFVGIYDEEAGILRANKCVLGMQELFKRRGGLLSDSTRVQRVHPGATVRVDSSKGTWYGRSLIVTTGAWTAPIMKRDLGLSLPLTAVRVMVCYWRSRQPHMCDIQAPFPCVVMYGIKPPGTDPVCCYAFPSADYPGCPKIGMHDGAVVDPDRQDSSQDSRYLEGIRYLVRNHIPCCEPDPAVVENCLYTCTPGEDFVVDNHPVWNNIAIGTGFSGTGFKLAPVIGRILGQLALQEKISYDLSTFRIARFKQMEKSHL